METIILFILGPILLFVGVFLFVLRNRYNGKASVVVRVITIVGCVVYILVYFVASLLILGFSDGGRLVYKMSKDPQQYVEHTLEVTHVHKLTNDYRIVGMENGQEYQATTNYSLIPVGVNEDLIDNIVAGDEVKVVIFQYKFNNTLDYLLVSLQKDGVQYIDTDAMQQALNEYANAEMRHYVLVSIGIYSVGLMPIASIVLNIVALAKIKKFERN